MNSKGTNTMTPTEVKEEDAGEREPCLPAQNNAVRKSLEDLNRCRDQEENASALQADKPKNSYQVNQTKKKSRLNLGCSLPTSKFEKWCKLKTGYTRFGLIVQAVLIFLLLVFIVTVLLMACLWPSIPHSFSFPICRTSACLLASSEVVTKMNQSIRPCRDLREYSCGQWLHTHQIPHDKSLWGTKQLMQFKHREKIRDMISTMSTHMYDPENIQWKIKNLYDSCMSLGSVETEEGRPLKKVISILGGWKVLREFSLVTWDMKRTLTQLHSKYNVQPFFKVEVVPDPIHPHESLIQISPGSLGLPNKNYYFRNSDDKVVMAYKRFLKDIAMNFGATSDEASNFAEDLFGFERRLAERFPSSWSQPRPHPNYRPTIAKLQEIAPSVPFFEILTATFRNAKLNMNSEVIVVASDHLVNVSRIISATDRSVLNDYMMWRLAIAYVPYLSKVFRKNSHEFHRHLYGNKDPSSRWEMCVETVQKFLGLGIEALLENQHSHELEMKKKVVKQIFEEIRKALTKSIEHSTSLPPHVQEHFLDKMKTLGCEIGLPGNMRLPSYYNQHYRSVTTIKDDFFQNVLYGVSFLLEDQENRINHPSEEHRWIDAIADGQLKVTYIPEINRIIIPFALLSMPFFNSHYPPSVQFGAIGTEIGLAMVASLTGRGLFHSGDGGLLPRDHPVSNITHDCFLHHPSLVPRLEALKVTFKALKSVLNVRPHTHQPALEYLEDQAVFFIAFAQSLCTMKTPEREDIEMAINSQSDDLSILQKVVAKSKEFKSTFSCQHSLEKDVCDSLI